MPSYKSIGYAILRVTVGMMFLFYGIAKFRGGIGSVADGIAKEFDGKLPGFLVIPYAHVLPFAEVFVGALLILGLFTEIGLICRSADA